MISPVGICFATVLLAASPALGLSLPNARLTPGAVGANDTVSVVAAQVCVRGYARAARHPYDTAWRHYRTALFRAYGIPHARWKAYTIDHLVPIELGGRPFGVIRGRDGRSTWDLRNVWPEPKNDARRKDAVENALRASVCAGGFRGVRPHTFPGAACDRERLDADARRPTVSGQRIA